VPNAGAESILKRTEQQNGVCLQQIKKMNFLPTEENSNAIVLARRNKKELEDFE